MATPFAPEYAFDSRVDHHLEVITFHAIRTANGIGHRLTGPESVSLHQNKGKSIWAR
jgi:hypothetical protein